jgi:UDP-glucose 4-epimerase
MKKVIVTGAAGFLGFHLCKRLLDEGIEVIGIDKFDRNQSNSIQDERLNFFGRNALFQFINEPIEHADLEQYKEEVDVLYHLADEQLKEVVEIYKTTKTRFILTSSTDVYGTATGIIDEESAANPESTLGREKLAEENWIEENVKQRSTILRIPLVIGPFQSPDTRIYQMLKSKLEGNETLNVEKEDCTDIVYVDDAVEALFLAGKHDNGCGIVNIVNDPPVQWEDVLAWFQSQKKPKSAREDELFNYSNEKAKRLLSFEPRVSINEMLTKINQHVNNLAK